MELRHLLFSVFNNNLEKVICSVEELFNIEGNGILAFKMVELSNYCFMPTKKSKLKNVRLRSDVTYSTLKYIDNYKGKIKTFIVDGVSYVFKLSD